METAIAILFVAWLIYDVIWWSICAYYRNFKQWRSRNG